MAPLRELSGVRPAAPNGTPLDAEAIASGSGLAIRRYGLKAPQYFRLGAQPVVKVAAVVAAALLK